MIKLLSILLLTTIFLPIISLAPPFDEGGMISCLPNAGTTYVNGHVYQGSNLLSGPIVAFSFQPDGPIVAQIQSGPHPGYPQWSPGFFSHILSATGPRAGNWFFWIVDGNGRRISVIVPVVTTASVGPTGCQQALIFFRRP